MVFTNFPYQDFYYVIDGKKEYNNCANFLDNKLGQYHLKHPENLLLSEIIRENKMIYYAEYDQFLCKCYQNLLDKNMIDIIYEMIAGDNSNDELAIAMVAINNNRFDILDILFTKGFNLNQMVLETKKYCFLNFDLLTYVVGKNNYLMVKFMVEMGADPLYNCAMPIINSCSHTDGKIYEYFMEQNIPEKFLTKIFSACCRNITIESDKNNTEASFKKIRILLEKGLDINEVGHNFRNGCKCNIEILQFLLENGMDIDQQIFLEYACTHSDKKMLDFLLKINPTVGPAVIKAMLENINIPIIKTFIEYDIDLSMVPIENKYATLIADLESKGLDKDILLNYFFKIIETKYSSVFRQYDTVS